MIVFLQGQFVVKTPAYVWIEVNGIGYEVNISLHTYSRIQQTDHGKLLTYLHIKEDGHSLFGFFDDEERSLFLQLISVSGVGTSTARMMLSSMKPEEIRYAIRTENEALLGKIKGIGPKSAKRLILELKDKVLKENPGQNMAAPTNNNPANDALFALVSLGIARNAASQAIDKTLKLQPDLALEDLIKQALKNI
jgi:Holliday junction DNA helicase RuvA